MKNQIKFKASCLVAALLFIPAAQAAVSSKSEYAAVKARMAADYKVDRAACDASSGNAKDVCVEKAKAREKVGLAEAEFAHTGSTEDGNKLQIAKAESAYAVAKEKCDEKSGNDKDICVKEAKAAEAKILGDVKMGKKIDSAMQEDLKTQRDANYKVGLEKCDALSGDAKTSCVTKLKATYGK